MKKLFCLLLTLLFAVSLSSLTVLAEDTNENSSEIRSAAIFGDSISAGFGLAGYDPNDLTQAKGSFANLIAEHYHISGNDSFFNSSKSGRTSSEILENIKKTDKSILERADLVVISAGANDIISIVGETAFSAYYSLSDEFAQKNVHIDFSDLVSVENTIISLWKDSSTQELINKFAELCTTEQVLTRYQDAVLKCESNLKEMIAYMREIGCEAQIFLLTPYNPASILPQNKLTDALQKTLQDLEQRCVSLCKSAEYGFKVSAVDLMEAFKDKYAEMTSISSLDIHPSAAGHQLIADMIVQDVEIALQQQHESQNRQRHSTAPVPNLVVYIIFSVAGAAVVGIVIYAVLIHRKK